MSDIATELEAMQRAELLIVAKKLKIVNRHKQKNQELTQSILKKDESEIRSCLNLTWWNRHHVHVYFAVGLAATVICGVLPFCFQHEPAQPEPDSIAATNRHVNEPAEAGKKIPNTPVIQSDKKTEPVSNVGKLSFLHMEKPRLPVGVTSQLEVMIYNPTSKDFSDVAVRISAQSDDVEIANSRALVSNLKSGEKKSVPFELLGKKYGVHEIYAEIQYDNARVQLIPNLECTFFGEPQIEFQTQVQNATLGIPFSFSISIRNIGNDIANISNIAIEIPSDFEIQTATGSHGRRGAFDKTDPRITYQGIGMSPSRDNWLKHNVTVKPSKAGPFEVLVLLKGKDSEIARKLIPVSVNEK